MKLKLVPLVCASSLLVLTACTMAPHYERPELPVALEASAAAEDAGSRASDLAWRSFYENDQVQKLIELAL